MPLLTSCFNSVLVLVWSVIICPAKLFSAALPLSCQLRRLDLEHVAGSDLFDEIRCGGADAQYGVHAGLLASGLSQRRPRKQYASKCNNETVRDSPSIDGFACAPIARWQLSRSTFLQERSSPPRQFAPRRAYNVLDRTFDLHVKPSIHPAWQASRWHQPTPRRVQALASAARRRSRS